MYFIPKPYKCQSCDSHFEWSQHHDQVGWGKPFCPKCYLEFLVKNIPQGISINAAENVKKMAKALGHTLFEETK